MSFASPLWWWALAGLAIPLAIHWLSRGRRQRVALGSIRHLQSSESRALRRVKLSGWQQLLLRGLLLAVLALALAGPHRPWTGRGSEMEGWVLIDPGLPTMDAGSGVGEGDFWRQMDAAKASAESVRLLAPGLPELARGDTFEQPIDAWSLLREADEMAPPRASFTVFTRDRLAMLRGRRPFISRPVDWRVLVGSESNGWIQRATSTVAGDLVVTIGESQAQGTRFRTHIWPASELPPAESNLQINTDLKTLELTPADAYPGDNSAPIPADRGPIRLAMTVGADRETDAWYLRRGLAVLGRYLGREIEWVEDPASPVDLEVRLGVAGAGGVASAVVLADSDSPHSSCQGQVYSSSMPGDPWLHLERCSTVWRPVEGARWWVDNWGRSFLSRRVGTTAAIYDLESRFDARWSNLVTSPVLPRLLLELVAPDHRSAGGVGDSLADRRATTGRERLPGKAEIAVVSPARQSKSIESLAWIMVALLVVLERWISGKMA